MTKYFTKFKRTFLILIQHCLLVAAFNGAFFLNTYAQEKVAPSNKEQVVPSSTSSKDQVTIVSVGKAQEKKTKIQLRVSHCEQLTGTTSLEKASEITRNDFSFYRHLRQLEVQKDAPPWNWSPVLAAELKKKGLDFLISWSCTPGKETLLKMVVSDLSVASIIYEKQISIVDVNERALIHKINNDAYEAMFKVPSVFTSKVIFVAAKSWGKNNSVKEIYQMDFDGYDIEQLTDHKGITISPAYSPDNRKIVYSLIDSKKKIKNISLYEMDLSTKVTTIISDKVGINSGAIYSADGKGLYMTLSHQQNSDIYYLDLATKAERRITSHMSEDVDPSITKDGKQLTFLSNRQGRAHVFTLDPSGLEKNVQRKSYVGEFNATPRYSPDGSEIVFSSWVRGGFNIYRLSSNGVLSPPLTADFGSNEDPTYSNDGQFLVFTSKQNNKKSTDPDQKIYIMNRFGEVLGPLTEKFVLCSSPRFSN